MKKSDQQSRAMSAHRRVSSSTTLNRRYVKRPARVDDVVTKQDTNVGERIPVSHFSSVMHSSQSAEQDVVAAPQAHPLQVTVNTKMRNRASSNVETQAKKPTAKQLKEQAIRRALAEAGKPTDTSETSNQKARKAKKSKLHGGYKVHFGFGRIMLAVSCAAAAVFAIAYFVNVNMPDISLRVAAMQTGIEATYPSYVPRDFSLSDITSESGKITMNFKNSSTGDSFTLVEEQSAWDSSALLSNYAKPTYGENYSTIREQGLTLYLSGSDACWVNGGVVFKLKTVSGSLTKKQIKAIAVSL